MLLDLFFKDLLHDFVVLHFGRYLHAKFFAAQSATSRAEFEEIIAGSDLDEVVVIRAAPRTREVDGARDIAVIVLVLDFQATAKFLREVAGHFLDEVGHFLEIRKRPVSFEHRELRIVAARNAFVAEVAVEFENFRVAADQQALEEKLRRNAQRERHAKRVVMRLERTRRRAARDILQHWRLDLEKSPVLQKLADLGKHQRTRHEEVRALRVAHQVEVTLAVFRLTIGEAMELVGHRSQRL